MPVKLWKDPSRLAVPISYLQILKLREFKHLPKFISMAVNQAGLKILDFPALNDQRASITSRCPFQRLEKQLHSKAPWKIQLFLPLCFLINTALTWSSALKKINHVFNSVVPNKFCLNKYFSYIVGCTGFPELDWKSIYHLNFSPQW